MRVGVRAGVEEVVPFCQPFGYRKGKKNKIKLWGMKNFSASVIFLVTVQEKVRPRVILKAEN